MLYLIKSGDYIKIGYATDINKRIRAYETHNPSLELLASAEGTLKDEKMLHDMCKSHTWRNEWFTDNEYVRKCFMDWANHHPITTTQPSTKKTIKLDIEDFIKNGVLQQEVLALPVIRRNILALIWDKSKYDNTQWSTVYLLKDIKEKWAEQLGCSVKTIDNNLTALTKQKYLSTLCRGAYVLNSQYFIKK